MQHIDDGSWIVCPENIAPLIGTELDAGVLGKVRIVEAKERRMASIIPGDSHITYMAMPSIIRIQFGLGPETA